MEGSEPAAEPVRYHSDGSEEDLEEGLNRPGTHPVKVGDVPLRDFVRIALANAAAWAFLLGIIVLPSVLAAVAGLWFFLWFLAWLGLAKSPEWQGTDGWLWLGILFPILFAILVALWLFLVDLREDLRRVAREREEQRFELQRALNAPVPLREDSLRRLEWNGLRVTSMKRDRNWLWETEIRGQHGTLAGERHSFDPLDSLVDAWIHAAGWLRERQTEQQRYRERRAAKQRRIP